MQKNLLVILIWNDRVVYMVTAINHSPQEILFQCLVYIINYITIVQNVWSYLPIITLILKAHVAICQSSGVCGFGIGWWESATSRMQLFMHMEMWKISTSKSAMRRGRPRRHRCEDAALWEMTEPAESLN